MDRALSAVGGGRYSAAAAEKALCAYFNPESDYAGALFNAIPDDDGYDLDNRVVAADLLAVTTLSMKLPAPLVRELLETSDEADAHPSPAQADSYQPADRRAEQR